MARKPKIESPAEWATAAEADMQSLGFDPSSPDSWRRYAILRFRDHQLITGIEKPGDPETVEVNRRALEADQQHASLARLFVVALRKIDGEYQTLKHPGQHDVLEQVVRSLEAISRYLAPLQISPFGGLPTPLEILMPELLNVQDDRLSRLLTPSDRVVASAREVPDSAQDRIRLTIQAYAAGAVTRLIESKKYPTHLDAYRRVAAALDKAGFRPPGKSKIRSYGPEAIRNWYEKALVGDGIFQRRYRRAVRDTPADPEHALDLLATHVRLFQFKRSAKRST